MKMSRFEAEMLWKQCCLALHGMADAFELAPHMVDFVFQTMNHRNLVTFEQWVARTKTEIDVPTEVVEKVSQNENDAAIAALQGMGLMQPKTVADAEAVLKAKEPPSA